MNESRTSRIVTRLRILYPIWMIVGMLSLLYIPSLIMDEQSSILVLNVKQNELLFRLGIVGSLITQILYIFIPLLFYYLFESIDRHLSLLTVAFSWISIPMTMYNELNKLEALTVLDDADHVLQLIEWNQQGINLASIFWGLWLFPLGLLCLKSGYFPKWIGYLVILGCIGYLLGALLKMIYPEAEGLYQVFELLTIGEIVFIFWLLIRGIQPKPMKRNQVMRPEHDP